MTESNAPKDHESIRDLMRRTDSKGQKYSYVNHSTLAAWADERDEHMQLMTAATVHVETANKEMAEVAGTIERLKKAADEEERQHMQSMEERDAYHAYADQLAECIAQMTRTEIGEHSSANCPWENAIEAACGFIADQNSSVEVPRDPK